MEYSGRYGLLIVQVKSLRYILLERQYAFLTVQLYM